MEALRAESITLRFGRCGFSPPGARTSLTTRPRTVTVCIFASGISMLRSCAPGATSMGAAAVASGRARKVGGHVLVLGLRQHRILTEVGAHEVASRRQAEDAVFAQIVGGGSARPRHLFAALHVLLPQHLHVHVATGSPSSSSTRPAITPCGVRRIARSLDFWPGSSVSRVPGLSGPRAPYCVAMNPLRSADRRYLPGAIPAMANRPAASVVAVLLTWMLVTPGDISIRRKDTTARRTGSPVAAFDTWPLTEQESSGFVWAASASGKQEERTDPTHAFRVAHFGVGHRTRSLHGDGAG